jgi:hypothetical protein
MKEKKLLKIQPLPKVLRVQAVRLEQLRDICNMIFITGQNEREETTQDTIVTKSAAYASYKSNYASVTATYWTHRVVLVQFGRIQDFFFKILVERKFSSRSSAVATLKGAFKK